MSGSRISRKGSPDQWLGNKFDQEVFCTEENSVIGGLQVVPKFLATQESLSVQILFTLDFVLTVT